MTPRLEWDEQKNLSNQRKHNMSFDLASQVFRDPLRLSVQDRDVDGEERWQTTGFVRGRLLVLVVHTLREDENEQEVVRIISARPAERKEGVAMKQKFVSYTLETLPEPTEADIRHLEELAARPDSEIDTTDIPVMSDEQWKNGKRRRLMAPEQLQFSCHVDRDVLQWLKTQGAGWESRVNDILRQEMLTTAERERKVA